MQQIDLGLTSEIEQIQLFEKVDGGADGKRSGQNNSARLSYHPAFITESQCSHLFDALLQKIQWAEESLWIAGNQRKVPRLVAWYGDLGTNYRYSGKLHEPLPWIDELYTIKQKLEVELETPFNSVLCNLYRNGQDSMGWHADDEKELGDDPFIASISLGQPRAFHLKHKTNPSLRHKMTLNSGSLLVMQGTTQRYWLHQVPKEPKITQPRINLTFRNIIG
ncbi:alpha-ketoglutarate-dependent dioxygenase AlkB [Kangiella japonica]|uniref:Alpha-ketoglutarate-dependent dioxygenase AlkB n=1 Tax=Kangiella japonica TaxID=647384 RepID=A0ABP3CEK8_9GAMM